MSLKCTVNSYDDKPISGMHIIVTLIDNPTLVFHGFTDSDGNVTRWRNPEDGQPTHILGPGWISSAQHTRWRITYETDHHLRQGHPFSTISVDLLMDSYCQHEVALLIASTSYGVFETRTTTHGLYLPEVALKNSPVLASSATLERSPRVPTTTQATVDSQTAQTVTTKRKRKNKEEHQHSGEGAKKGRRSARLSDRSEESTSKE